MEKREFTSSLDTVDKLHKCEMIPCAWKKSVSMLRSTWCRAARTQRNKRDFLLYEVIWNSLALRAEVSLGLQQFEFMSRMSTTFAVYSLWCANCWRSSENAMKLVLCCSSFTWRTLIDLWGPSCLLALNPSISWLEGRRRVSREVSPFFFFDIASLTCICRPSSMPVSDGIPEEKGQFFFFFFFSKDLLA